jgi:hypothetical protein
MQHVRPDDAIMAREAEDPPVPEAGRAAFVMMQRKHRRFAPRVSDIVKLVMARDVISVVAT